MTRATIRNPLIDRDMIRLAMLGCSARNRHPYSRIPMFNRCNRELMTTECLYTDIPDYLNMMPAKALSIPGTKDIDRLNSPIAQYGRRGR